MQVGVKNIETSLDIVYNLEQIAQNDLPKHWETIELLTIFVRNNSPYVPQEKSKGNLKTKIRTDIQAALTVIARKNVEKDAKNQLLDLSNTDMQGVNLDGANLAGANLYQVNLAGVNLKGANLSGRILSASNVAEANLSGANLTGSILNSANLCGANLHQANLHYTN
ncbi:MAG: pentapeptide repeat-containing protein, partial [Tolypothrix sp. Co-bin9]|nr:pentapeptide repeat-containing protein [Tolypothrix sp. Co-bin9]